MGIAPLDRHTYLPDAGDEVARVHDFLAGHGAIGEGAPGPHYLLAGPAPGQQVELPPEIHRILRQVVEAMSHDLAVTVVPQAKTLTTQQAADLLGVSRPTVVKLLDEDKIPSQRVGTHRRVLLADLLVFREQRRAQQYAALDAMSDDIEEEGDVDAVLARLRRVRREIARQRRGAAS